MASLRSLCCKPPMEISTEQATCLLTSPKGFCSNTPLLGGFRCCTILVPPRARSRSHCSNRAMAACGEPHFREAAKAPATFSATSSYTTARTRFLRPSLPLPQRVRTAAVTLTSPLDPGSKSKVPISPIRTILASPRPRILGNGPQPTSIAPTPRPRLTASASASTARPPMSGTFRPLSLTSRRPKTR